MVYIKEIHFKYNIFFYTINKLYPIIIFIMLL